MSSASSAYHLVGIGGIGMSAIARLLLARGARVSGSRDGRIHVILGAPSGLPVVPATMPNASAREAAPGALSSVPSTD